MWKMRIVLPVVVMATAAALLGSSPRVHAEQPRGEIGYAAELVDGAVVLRTGGGSLTADAASFRINDDNGRALIELPLSYHRDGLRWPIAATIDGNTATLRPSVDPSAAVPEPQPIAQPHDIGFDPQSADFNNALMRFSTQLNVGVMLGTLVGTAIGAGIGCLVGGVVGAAAGLVATVGVLAIPGFLGGCLATGLVGSTIGAAVGTIAIGLPMAIFGGLLFLDALNQPPTK
ncbi:hypothetical protein [Nocardia sp. XZ_19_369]|uniref:hypothetical protein n=1 Tax=Nocardia sp. XZ_19_369 TaxID=2769487 RepID=UPI001E56FA55|nr:hypothetical protein [Nocardia sp. XZ_19_369]